MLTFVKQNARWLAGGLILTFFSSFGQTFFIGLSGAELRARFALSDGEFGIMYMIATLASAATLPFAGRLLDSMPGRQVAGLVIPPLAFACVLIAFAPTFVLALLALTMLRLFGQGMMTHIALTETGRWFAARRGRAISLIVPGHQAGEALLPAAFVLLAAAFGWQSAWLAAAAALMLIALPAILILYAAEREPSRQEAISAGTATPTRDWTRREVVSDPLFYALLTGVLAPAFIGTTVFFHQDYLVQLRGYDPLAFATAFPLMAATTIAFSLLCGQLIDKVSAVRLLPFFLLPLALASAVAGLLEPVWGIYLFMTLLGISYGLSSTLFGALWPEIYGVRYLGGIRALIVAAMVFATALGPGLTGYLIDYGIGLDRQLIWMSGWCLAASFMLAVVAAALARRSAPVTLR
ncbi:MAG: MFS transporter [Erythrobacter sp.]